jgi:hypothetical protein
MWTLSPDGSAAPLAGIIEAKATAINARASEAGARILCRIGGGQQGFDPSLESARFGYRRV